MLTRHIALVSEKSSIKMSELTTVAGALQKQATRDFGPIWNIEAVVTAFGGLEDVPMDYWPVIIKDDIGDPSAAGYHDDDQGQPFSLVQYSQGWTLTASHEVLEMLADPFGRRLVAGQSPKTSQGRVKFLVEVCDPCEADAQSYTVNGIRVSDFYTPRFFDPVAATGVRYSFRGTIHKPREVLRGGYLSWYDPASRTWWQRSWFGSKAKDVSLGKLKIMNGNIRASIDRITVAESTRAMKRSSGRGLTPDPARSDRGFAHRAADLRMAIAKRSSR